MPLHCSSYNILYIYSSYKILNIYSSYKILYVYIFIYIYVCVCFYILEKGIEFCGKFQYATEKCQKYKILHMIIISKQMTDAFAFLNLHGKVISIF